MYQIIEQTEEEKMKMYMKCTKKELASMLIQSNKILDTQMPIVINHTTPQICPNCKSTDITEKIRYNECNKCETLF